MSVKKKYIKQGASRKIKRLDQWLKAMIYIMTGVVIYDSFVHDTPLFYVLFYFVGLFGGRVYRFVSIVEAKQDTHEFMLRTSKWDLGFTICLFLIRFIYGSNLLESMHVVWVSDALYLFFIGIYRSKWKGIVSQIDEIVYQWIDQPGKA